MAGLLTAAERERFAEWLEAEAASDRELARQLEKVAGPAGRYMAEGKAASAAAKELVLAELRATETFSL